MIKDIRNLQPNFKTFSQICESQFARNRKNCGKFKNLCKQIWEAKNWWYNRQFFYPFYWWKFQKVTKTRIFKKLREIRKFSSIQKICEIAFQKFVKLHSKNLWNCGKSKYLPNSLANFWGPYLWSSLSFSHWSVFVVFNVKMQLVVKQCILCMCVYLLCNYRLKQSSQVFFSLLCYLLRVILDSILKRLFINILFFLLFFD